MNMNLRIEQLRKDLLDYYTSAYFMVSPLALIDITKIESASNQEIIEIAKENKFDLTKYIY